MPIAREPHRADIPARKRHKVKKLVLVCKSPNVYHQHAGPLSVRRQRLESRGDYSYALVDEVQVWSQSLWNDLARGKRLDNAS